MQDFCRSLAAFADPEVYEDLETRGLKYAIRLPAMRATELPRVRGVEGVLWAVPLAHRIESAAARGSPPGFPLWVWSWMVGAGSRAAVAVCRHI